MDTQHLCQNCQAPLAADAPRGLCPACLMKVAMASGTVGGQEKPPFTPPGLEELAGKFPQLEIIELIGRGGMGAVYKARQKELDRIVALKILPPGVGDDPAFAQRFAREAKALARLNHPGIVTIHDFGRANGLYFFVMEFVDGVNLRQLLASSRVSPREALAIVPQICDALQFAHDQGIVHRDIKPENILLDRRGRVKVADFGLAKLVGADALSHPMREGGAPAPGEGVPSPAVLTEAGKIMGTPQYMSPEQIEAPGEVDHRADIYALGVVFYQMLTGELPGQPLEPPSKKVHLDVRLDEIVLRALEEKPELRYQQASAIKTQVETIAATPQSADVPPAEPELVTGLSRQEAEEFGRNLGAMFTSRGLLSFTKRGLLWFARQGLLLFDFTATVPPFVKTPEGRRFNFWPSLLLFGSTIGFMVNSLILAFSVAQRLRHGAPPHGTPLALTAQEGNFLIWAVLGAIGRLAALNLGQAPKEITARRVVVVSLWMLAWAAMIPCQLLLTDLLSATSPTDLTNAAWFAKWIGGGVLLAVGLFLLGRVVLFFIRLYAGVWREIKVKTEESANSDGLPAVEAWLRLLDAGNYAQCWETAAASFQRARSKEQWVSQMRQVRRPLGKVLSRQLSPPQFKAGWTRFGASFIFATAFEGLPAATETVTFTRQRPNGEWKAVSYLVQPAGDDQEQPQPSDSPAADLKTQGATTAKSGSAITPEFAPPISPGRRPLRWSWLGLVLGLLVALAVVSVMLNVPPKPAAVIDVLPVPSDHPPGLTLWHWKCVVPAQHVLLFTVVSYSSNGAASVSEELSSYCGVGSVKDREFIFELTRQDGAMLSPELRNSYRWNKRWRQKDGGAAEPPVWVPKDQPEGVCSVPGEGRLVIHDGETNAVVIAHQFRSTAVEHRRMEIQIHLHALPSGLSIGPYCAFERGTDWLESSRRFSDQLRRKAAGASITSAGLPRAVTFGLETERTLLFNTNGTTDYLGFASNQLVRFPTATRPPGGIAFVDDAENSAILMGSAWGTLLMPASGREWDSLAAAKCVEKVATKTNLRSTASARRADLPATYLFRTDPGLIGMLMIASSTHGENGVGIRYKLVTESSTNALFPATELTPASRPNGSKPIPQQAVQLFNQSRDLQALMIPLYESQAPSSRVRAARLVMQMEEIQSQLTSLAKGTPVEGVRWDQARLARQREQVDWSKDQDKWRQLATEMEIAQFNEERLMVGAGAADFIQPQANQLQFGSWIETTLPHPSAGKDCCLDFDSGQRLTPPPDILAAMPAKPKPGKDVIEAMPEELGWGALRSAAKETNAVVRWILESGVGAVEMAPHRLIVFCPVRTISPIADPVSNPDWERQLTPAWLLWKLHQAEKYATAQPVPANAMEFLTFPSGSFSSTNSLCLFRTRARAMGLLQIMGFTDNPPGVKIRYKLVRNRNS